MYVVGRGMRAAREGGGAISRGVCVNVSVAAVLQVTSIEIGGVRGCSKGGISIEAPLCRSDADSTLQTSESLSLAITYTPDCTSLLVHDGKRTAHTCRVMCVAESLWRLKRPQCASQRSVRYWLCILRRAGVAHVERRRQYQTGGHPTAAVDPDVFVSALPSPCGRGVEVDAVWLHALR